MPTKYRTYTPQFRQDAVDLLISSGRPLKQVAEELGVTANSLRNWREKAFSNGRAAKIHPNRVSGSEDRSGAPIGDLAAELRRLHKENEYLKRQREILKKALSILSEDPQSGMR